MFDIFLRKFAFYETMWKKKYDTARPATDDHITLRRKDALCVPGN